MAISPLGLRNKGSFSLTRTRRPIVLGVVGDSAAGKTTLTRGIENIFGQHRVNSICSDDYHRYDREARKQVQLTPLNPLCNYMDIMEQHLQLLAMGEPILKPVYNHSHGTLDIPYDQSVGARSPRPGGNCCCRGFGVHREISARGYPRVR